MNRRTTATTLRTVLAAICLLLALDGLALAQSSGARPTDEAGAPGATANDPKRLRCGEHDAYEDECFICHPELREKGRLWCQEHARYEDRCFLCHPELRQTERSFCEKHFLYQDECHLCRPELTKPASGDAGAAHGPADEARGAEAAPAASERLMCKEHGVPEDECGICHPELAATLSPDRGLKIRMASRDAARKAGIETRPPTVGEMSDAVECYAEIVFNQNQLAHVVSPVEGVLRQASADLGEQVAEGSVLATVASPAIADAVNEAVLTRQTLERERSLYSQRISAHKEVQAAEASYRIAHQHLQTLGFSKTQITALGSEGAPDNSLDLRAPFAGEIVERNAVVGERVEPGKSLYLIADRSTMWAILNVPEAQLERIRVGQRVDFTTNGTSGRTFAGTLTWIAPSIDEHTRMAQARVEIPNPDGSLRAHTFAHARILIATTSDALIVPRSAIERIENRPFAFVRLEDDLFEARAVEIGAKSDDAIAITAGLRPGEDVVVANAFLVKSQLQISRLGAGCTD